MVKLSPEDRRVLADAKKHGWIQPAGDTLAQCRQEEAWALRCREEGDDFISVLTQEGARVVLEIHPRRQLSTLGYQEMLDFSALHGLHLDTIWRPGGYTIQVPAKKLLEVAGAIKRIAIHDRLPERALALRRLSPLQEGMARPHDLSGLWEDLRPEDLVYVREIAGNPGRCIVLRHLHPALVDMPLAQFQILHRDEV